MLDKTDKKKYTTLQMFLDDIHLLVTNAEEYNPTDDEKQIVSKAKALEDFVLSWAHRMRKYERNLLESCENMEKQNEAASDEGSSRGQSNSDKSSTAGSDVDRLNTRRRSKKTQDKNQNENTDQAKEKSRVGDMEEDDNNVDNGNNSGIDSSLLGSNAEVEPILDKDRLQMLSELLLDKTKGFTVDALHAIHVSIYQAIHKNRHIRDKTNLLVEIEKIIVSANPNYCNNDHSDTI